MESNSVDRFYLRKKALKCEDTRHMKQHIPVLQDVSPALFLL